LRGFSAAREVARDVAQGTAIVGGRAVGMNRDFDVIVVGGGLAGLAAGATAAQGGATVVVLDAHQPGGRAQTSERDGFVFNRGIHALFTAGEGKAVLDALGVRLTGAAPPLGQYRLLADGAQHLLPLDPAGVAATTYLDAADKAQLADVFGRLPTLDPRGLAGQSVGGWLDDLGLRPRVDSLLRALFRLATYAADLDELGADAGIAQQQAAARGGVQYLDGGWAQLVDALRSLVEVRAGVPVRAVTADALGAAVHTDDGTLTARSVVLAVGTPQAARPLLGDDPGWGNLGDPVTAACLDVGVRRVPAPGYLVSVDEPLYGTTQSPPARHAPPGGAVVGVIRYGARSAALDRPSLEAHLGQLGVADSDIVTSRFLARMIVSSTMTRAAAGGLEGRPDIAASGLPRVLLAGDWVGRVGLLSDAAIASGHAAALAALQVGHVFPERVA
jgi:glycine/D-amino acid oxidase-like deaminating enzyme